MGLIVINLYLNVYGNSIFHRILPSIICFTVQFRIESESIKCDSKHPRLQEADCNCQYFSAIGIALSSFFLIPIRGITNNFDMRFDVDNSMSVINCSFYNLLFKCFRLLEHLTTGMIKNEQYILQTFGKVNHLKHYNHFCTITKKQCEWFFFIFWNFQLFQSFAGVAGSFTSHSGWIKIRIGPAVWIVSTASNENLTSFILVGRRCIRFQWLHQCRRFTTANQTDSTSSLHLFVLDFVIQSGRTYSF